MISETYECDGQMSIYDLENVTGLPNKQTTPEQKPKNIIHETREQGNGSNGET